MGRLQDLAVTMLIAVVAWGVAKCIALAGEPRTLAAAQQAQMAAGLSPTFYRDVLPILQQHCEICHRVGGIAPMSFASYQEARAYAESIRTATGNRSMPPWFAVPGIGHFSNDPSLTAE